MRGEKGGVRECGKTKERGEEVEKGMVVMSIKLSFENRIHRRHSHFD